MKYYKPEDVTSPADFIESVTVIHDGGANSFSVAKISWEGQECIGIRWNVARREHDDPEKKNGNQICVGMPSSHGYPVWFVLPDELLEDNSEIRKMINEVYP
jgi:hypothetical protein